MTDDVKKYTEKTEVTTETERDEDRPARNEFKKETTVKTERTVEKEKDEPVVIIQND